MKNEVPYAVKVRSRGANRDETIHVERFHPECRPCAVVEARAEPELNGGCENQRGNSHPRLGEFDEWKARNECSKHEVEHRQAQDESDEKLSPVYPDLLRA